MTKIGIVGLFWYDVDDCGGGVIKTRNFEHMLCDQYGREAVNTLDRSTYTKGRIRWIFRFLKITLGCKSIVILFPTEKMIRTFLPLLCTIKKIKNYQIIYPVLGGWLPERAENEDLRKYLIQCDVIYVETLEMKNKLRNVGMKNIEYMPNYSIRKPIDVINETDTSVFKFCIFSRIIKEKGIELAIDAISAVNQRVGKVVCKLDIFGKVYDEYKCEFEKKMETAQSFIQYKGMLHGDEAIEKLSTYYMLLFPTFYAGEGFPGTLIEALMSGLPTIASDWKYNKEIIKSKKTGILFSLSEENGLISAIEYSINHENEIINMRRNCLIESFNYRPKEVMQPLFKLIDTQGVKVNV